MGFHAVNWKLVQFYLQWATTGGPHPWWWQNQVLPPKYDMTVWLTKGHPQERIFLSHNAIKAILTNFNIVRTNWRTPFKERERGGGFSHCFLVKDKDHQAPWQEGAHFLRVGKRLVIWSFKLSGVRDVHTEMLGLWWSIDCYTLVTLQFSKLCRSLWLGLHFSVQNEKCAHK